MIIDSIPLDFHKHNPFSYCFYYMQCCRSDFWQPKSIKTLSIPLGCATIIIRIIMEMSWNKMMELMRSINTIQTALHIRISILSYRNMNIRFFIITFLEMMEKFVLVFRFFPGLFILIFETCALSHIQKIRIKICHWFESPSFSIIKSQIKR